MENINIALLNMSNLNYTQAFKRNIDSRGTLCSPNGTVGSLKAELALKRSGVQICLLPQFYASNVVSTLNRRQQVLYRFVAPLVIEVIEVGS